MLAECHLDCGHCTCVNGSCICDAGWSGNADLLTQDLRVFGDERIISCPSNIISLKAMWLGVFAISAIQSIVCIRGISQQWRIASTRKECNEISFYWQHLPLLFRLIYMSITIPSLICLSLAKLTSHDLRHSIGVNLLVSIPYCAYQLSINCAMLIHVFHSIKQILLRERLLEGMSRNVCLKRVTKIRQIIIMAFGFSGSLVPVISSSQHDADLQWRCFFLHNALTSAGFLTSTLGTGSTAFQMYFAMTEILKARTELADQTNSEELRSSLSQLRRLRRKLTSLHVVAACQGVLQGSLFLVFLAVPALRNKMNYLIVVSALFPVLVNITQALLLYVALPGVSASWLRAQIQASHSRAPTETEAVVNAGEEGPGTAASISQMRVASASHGRAHQVDHPQPTAGGGVNDLGC